MSLSPFSLKICNPILSLGLNKKINDLPCLSRAWKVSKKNEENLIDIGDIIKMGRVRLKIETICIGEMYKSSHPANSFLKNKIKLKYRGSTNINKNINNHINTNINNSQIESALDEEKLDKNKIKKKINEKNVNSNFENSSFSSPNKSTSRPICRICYLYNSDVENPLISLCNCSGSMKYIHYKCLKHYIEVNLTKKIELNYKSYNWKNYSCEICKKEYPKYFKIKDTLYPLIDLEINFSSYMICDYCLYDDTKKKTNRKGILVIKINDNVDEDIITLGRSQNNNIKLKDISVSRNHCNIIKRKYNLFVVDKGSKFGSLLYMNNPLDINSNNNEEALISGRHWFSIQLEENRSFFSKLFSVQCCENSLIKKNTNIDIEHLDEKNFDNQNEIVNDNDNANLKDNNYKDSHRILDNSYQDYILDLGNDIYLHDDQSDSEDLK